MYSNTRILPDPMQNGGIFVKLEIEALGRCEDTRNAFILEFVQTGDWYREHIEKSWMKNGLPYYSGFLWECMRFPDEIRVSEREGLQLLSEKDTVLFLFDFFDHERDSSYQPPNIEPFNRPDWEHLVYRAKASDLIDLIREERPGENEPIKLPQEVYIFDESLTWFIAFGGDDAPGNKRICIRCDR